MDEMKDWIVWGMSLVAIWISGFFLGAATDGAGLFK